MKVVGLIPIKMNNERTPGKNTKCFSDGTPLITFVQKALLGCENIDEVYVYCSKEEIKEFLLPGVKYLKRDEKYDTPQADVNDMFYRFTQDTGADITVLAHATAPFQKSESISAAIEVVKSGEYDSAVAVKRYQDFLWMDGKPYNYDTLHIPRTQDLEPVYMETTGLYVFTKEAISTRRSRIGEKPFAIEVSDIEAVDINNPIDFEIADAIYTHIINK